MRLRFPKWEIFVCLWGSATMVMTATMRYSLSKFVAEPQAADRAAGMRENRGIGRLDVHTAACVREALAQQREVIAELVKRVEKDMRDMRIMMKHLPELDSEKWHQGKNYS